ncbi:MAG TPA: hypothetical protein VG759_26505 [Candidatus Angelobacter sp.]|nr:hypothetical protein [Candidatus Angelobacter sp.]
MTKQTLLLLTIVACSAISFAQTLTSAQVMHIQIGQVWNFQDGNGHHMTITLEAPQGNFLPSNCVVWHYTKDHPNAYWAPGNPGAEQWFPVCPAADGSWASPHYFYNWAGGCPGCATPTCPVVCAGPQSSTKTVVPNYSGALQTPYFIIPNSTTTTAVHTAWTSYLSCDLGFVMTWSSVQSPANCTHSVGWNTWSYTANVSTPAYSGPAMVSEQFEGACINDVNDCVHEKWFFAPNLGLVQVIPIASGTALLDPNLTMSRM